MKLNFFLLAFSFMLFFSCKNEKTPTVVQDETVQLPLDSVTYDLKVLSEEYCANNGRDTLCATADAQLIEFKEGMNSGATEKMQQHLRGMVSNDTVTIEQTMQNFLRKIDEFVDEEDEYLPSGFAMDIKQKIRTNTPLLVNGEQFYYQYSGGAHGVYYTEYFNFDAQTGEHLEWQNQFNDTLQVMTAAEKELLSKFAAGTKLSERYDFADDKFYLPGNFMLQPDSIAFLYTVYEIGPYVMGETEIKLPYSALKDNVKAGSVLKKIMEK